MKCDWCGYMLLDCLMVPDGIHMKIQWSVTVVLTCCQGQGMTGPTGNLEDDTGRKTSH